VKKLKDFLMNQSELKFIKKHYNSILSKAKIYYESNDIDSSLNLLELAATIAWICPFNPSFGDELIENLLLKISKRLNFKNYQKSNKILLYCTSIRDFGALVEQYLYNLPNVVLILHGDFKKNNSHNVFKYLLKNNIEYYTIDKKNSFIMKSEFVNNIIYKVKPKKIFLHLDPNDVFAASYFIKLKEITFFINHGDHLFWIGKNSFKNIIEFRNYGYWFSNTIRKLKNPNYFVVPFYPILPQEIISDQLDVPNNMVIGISGGNLYKYNQDPDLFFFKIIIKILKKNKNFYFILCGDGDSTRIKKLIKNQNIESRFKVLGFRKDFSHLIDKSDIYFNSYPVGGGLAQLYALYHKVPIVSVVNKIRSGDSLEEVFEIPTFKSLESLHEVEDFTDRLIKNKLFRQEIIKKQTPKSSNKKHFIGLLNEIIEDKVKPQKALPFKKYNFNFDLNLQNSLNEKEIFNDIIYWSFIYNIKNANFFMKFKEYIFTIKHLRRPSLLLFLKIHVIFFNLKGGR